MFYRRGYNLYRDRAVIEQIADSIRTAGYDPYAQLCGYLSTGNDSYITRQGNARDLIKQVDKTALEAFLIILKTKQS